MMAMMNPVVACMAVHTLLYIVVRVRLGSALPGPATGPVMIVNLALRLRLDLVHGQTLRDCCTSLVLWRTAIPVVASDASVCTDMASVQVMQVYRSL